MMYHQCLLLIAGLALMLPLCFAMSNGLLHQDCNFSQRLKPGNIYYIYNPDYPNASNGRHYCKWNAESDYGVKLICNIFEIPRVRLHVL